MSNTQTDALPPPLTTVEIDLKGYPAIMLDAERLLQSDTWAIANGDESKAAVTLWCRAWRQCPPGSLPNDDATLARLVGVALPKWRKMRPVATRGFVLCSDGRLYHPKLCEDARRCWETASANRAKTAAATDARRRRDGQRDDHRDGQRDEDRNVDRNDVPTTTSSSSSNSTTPKPPPGAVVEPWESEDRYTRISQAVGWFSWESLSPNKRAEFMSFARELGPDRCIEVMKEAVVECDQKSPSVWREWSISKLAALVVKRAAKPARKPQLVGDVDR